MKYRSFFYWTTLVPDKELNQKMNIQSWAESAESSTTIYWSVFHGIKWRIVKFRSFKSEDKKFRYKRQLRNAKEKASSHIGIVKFAEDAEVVQSIETPSTAEELRDMAAELQKTEEPTFLGKALEFTRLKQFL